MSGYERIKYRDFTTNIGGPVLRDRLWFFAGYQHLRDYDSQPGTDPQFPRTYEQDKVFAKLTWRLAPGLQLLQSFHGESWVNPELPTFVKPFEATQYRHASVPAMTFGHLTHTLAPSTVWDVRVGRFVYNRDDDPSTGNVTTIGRFDRVTGVFSDAPQSFGGLTLIRTTSKATVNHYQPAFLGVDHQWRIGGQLEKGEHHLSTIIPGGVRFVDSRRTAVSEGVERSLDRRRCVRHRRRLCQRCHYGRQLVDRQCGPSVRSQPCHQSGPARARFTGPRHRPDRPRRRHAVSRGTCGRRGWVSR